jgi:hypothetical protein
VPPSARVSGEENRPSQRLNIQIGPAPFPPPFDGWPDPRHCEVAAEPTGLRPEWGVMMIKAGLAVAAGCLGLGVAFATPTLAAPGQNCMPEEPVIKYGVTIGKRVTCYNPDGSSWVCTVLGTSGSGPETCAKNPAPATPGPDAPVPGGPPPPP